MPGWFKNPGYRVVISSTQSFADLLPSGAGPSEGRIRDLNRDRSLRASVSLQLMGSPSIDHTPFAINLDTVNLDPGEAADDRSAFKFNPFG